MRHNSFNKEESQRLIDWAMANGVNHFEACWFYMNGECEPYLYSLLDNYKREDYEICGKLPIHNVLDHMTHQQVFEEQLRRVPGHYFDTYILQALDDIVFYDIQQKKIVDYFLEQKKKGTIKRFGLSIQCLPSTFKKYLEWKCWDVVQMPINYYDWFLCRYDECYKLACDYGLPIIAQAPVKGGLLVKPNNIKPDMFDVSLTESAMSFVKNLDNIEMIYIGKILQNSEKASGTLNIIQNVGEKSFIRDSYDAISGSRSLYPLQNGKYITDNLRERKDNLAMIKEQVGFSIDLSPTFQTNRTLLRIHPDGGFPGTEGCIGLIESKSRLMEFKELMSLYYNQHSKISLTVEISGNENHSTQKKRK